MNNCRKTLLLLELEKHRENGVTPSLGLFSQLKLLLAVFELVKQEARGSLTFLVFANATTALSTVTTFLSLSPLLLLLLLLKFFSLPPSPLAQLGQPLLETLRSHKKYFIILPASNLLPQSYISRN